MTEEYTIREDAEVSQETTELVHDISTLATIIDRYNSAMDGIAEIKSLACPGLTEREQALMVSLIGGVAFGMREVGKMILKGRETYYAEKGVELGEHEKGFERRCD